MSAEVKDVLAFMVSLGMKPYPWQKRFLEEYLRPAWKQPNLEWDNVVCGIVRVGSGRASGRTTILAILIAVDDDIPIQWNKMDDWLPDHWSTRQSGRLMYERAREYRRRWKDWKERL